MHKKTRPNLNSVAKRAGVSPATVSRVLNNTAPVRESVRQRVLASMTTLGYQPPPKVSSASPKNVIALLIPDILNPYFAEIVRGIQDEAITADYSPVLFDSAEDPQREHQILRMLGARMFNGIIVCGSRLASNELLAIHARQSEPMVVINRALRQLNIACIVVDVENAAYRATRHLINLNHTRIGFLAGPMQSEQSQARRRGVEKALLEANLGLRAEWGPASFPNVDGGFQAMSALLALMPTDRPTAVIAYNDIMAVGALHAIRAHHLRVPEDISVIGFDDIAMAAHTNPPLTTVAQPKYRMGRTAMQTLRRMMQGFPPPEEGFTLMESPLIVRESTAPISSNGASQ